MLNRDRVVFRRPQFSVLRGGDLLPAMAGGLVVLGVAFAAWLVITPVAAVGVAAAFVWLVLRPPIWAAVALVPLAIPLGSMAHIGVMGGGFVLTYADAAIGVAALTAMVRGWSARGPLLVPGVMWVLWSALGVLFAANLGFALSGLKNVILAALVLLTAQAALRQDPLATRKLLMAVALTSTVIAALVMFTVITKNPSAFANSLGSKSQSDLAFGRSNYLAAMMVFGAAASVAVFTWTGARGRWLVAATLPLQVVAIVATGSRGQTLALAVVWLLTLRLYFRRWKKAATGIALGMAGLAALAYVYLGEYLQRIWRPALEAGATGFSTAQARFDIWRTALGDFVENPIIGIGMKNFVWNGDFAMVHNWALQALTETGLVGLALFLAILARAWRTSAGPHRSLLTFFLVIAAVSGSLEPTVFTRDYDYMFWVVVGVLAAGSAPKQVATSAPASDKASSPARNSGRRLVHTRPLATKGA